MKTIAVDLDNEEQLLLKNFMITGSVERHFLEADLTYEVVTRFAGGPDETDQTKRVNFKGVIRSIEMVIERDPER